MGSGDAGRDQVTQEWERSELDNNGARIQSAQPANFPAIAMSPEADFFDRRSTGSAHLPMLAEWGSFELNRVRDFFQAVERH
jgi:hypothetical protein